MRRLQTSVEARDWLIKGEASDVHPLVDEKDVTRTRRDDDLVVSVTIYIKQKDRKDLTIQVDLPLQFEVII